MPATTAPARLSIRALRRLHLPRTVLALAPQVVHGGGGSGRRGVVGALRTVLLAVGLLACLPVCAQAASPLKVVTYRGYRLLVPRAWPVYDLARNPSVCVRFNRHAVYLGQPSSSQRCPAHAAGRTEAILVSPVGAGAAAAGLLSAGDATPVGAGADAGTLFNRAHGVLVTATWRRDAAAIRRALGLRSLSALAPLPGAAAPGSRVPRPRDAARIASGAPALPGQVYTGPGFDVCSAPSYAQMAAWGSSSYRAIGVYIGGVNMACAQPNLTAAWVSQESSSGWHLLPIYVGLQAPSNSCGCAGISSAAAASQGTAAALDAVSKAQALGLGAGNPIYFDMEAYPRGGANTAAVLSFLAAWTSELHAKGYRSGVYSSDYSGMYDLRAQVGTGYSEPDVVWFANWNGAANTDDAVLDPDWSDHQRVHQYNGGQNETHGGVTLNIDGDYTDAPTAAAGTASSSPAGDLAAASPPGISGQAIEGQTLEESHAGWSVSPTAYSYQWEDCTPSGSACSPIPGATGQSYTLAAGDIGHALRVVETATDSLGSASATSNATGQVMSPTPLYWRYTARGNVYPSGGTPWYGSPYASGVHIASITGMAATPDGRGYWLIDAGGAAYAFGDAAPLPAPRAAHPIAGIVASPTGGYWVYTVYGNVYGTPGTPWYGSPYASGFRLASITGMAATPDGRGYWLVGTGGRVYAYGDASGSPWVRRPVAIRGIVASPSGGFWLYTAHGNVYGSPGTPWYGSPAASGLRLSSITGMAATPDGRGYWLVGTGGWVYPYGDAPSVPNQTAGGIAGIAGG